MSASERALTDVRPATTRRTPSIFRESPTCTLPIPDRAARHESGETNDDNRMGQPVSGSEAVAVERAPYWRTAAYSLVPFAILIALAFVSAFVLVPLFVFTIYLARQGRVARPVVWSFGIASVLAVVLAGALAFPQDRVEITDSGGAQVVGE